LRPERRSWREFAPREHPVLSTSTLAALSLLSCSP
jgi:hypothetical protein